MANTAPTTTPAAANATHCTGPMLTPNSSVTATTRPWPAPRAAVTPADRSAIDRDGAAVSSRRRGTAGRASAMTRPPNHSATTANSGTDWKPGVIVSWSASTGCDTTDESVAMSSSL